MKLDLNLKHENVHIFTTEEVIRKQVKDFIRSRMDEANAGPVNQYNRKTKGWSMSEILAEVSVRFGEDVVDFAKRYIVTDICGIK
ncbi:hypothetical protein OAJ77_00705 [Rhodospirillales bacterium]|nr:hypothetical protein [Rhodospirillales bacterium]